MLVPASRSDDYQCIQYTVCLVRQARAGVLGIQIDIVSLVVVRLLTVVLLCVALQYLQLTSCIFAQRAQSAKIITLSTLPPPSIHYSHVVLTIMCSCVMPCIKTKSLQGELVSGRYREPRAQLYTFACNARKSRVPCHRTTDSLKCECW